MHERGLKFNPFSSFLNWWSLSNLKHDTIQIWNLSRSWNIFFHSLFKAGFILWNILWNATEMHKWILCYFGRYSDHTVMITEPYQTWVSRSITKRRLSFSFFRWLINFSTPRIPFHVFFCIKKLSEELYSNCDALRNLVPLVQFKKREKHPWRNVSFSKVAGFKFNTPPWVFFTFFKLYKWYQIVQRTTFTKRSIIRLININPFQASGFFLYPLKTSKKAGFLMFSGSLDGEQWY